MTLPTRFQVSRCVYLKLTGAIMTVPYKNLKGRIV